MERVTPGQRPRPNYGHPQAPKLPERRSGSLQTPRSQLVCVIRAANRASLALVAGARNRKPGGQRLCAIEGLARFFANPGTFLTSIMHIPTKPEVTVGQS